MQKTKILFPLFLSILLMSSLFFTPSVNATISYYNHLQNPSFLNESNYIEDSSFESGAFESGLIYGNWSDPNTKWDFNSDESNSSMSESFFTGFTFCTLGKSFILSHHFLLPLFSVGS